MIEIPPPKFAELFSNVEFIIKVGPSVPFIKIAPPPKSLSVLCTELLLAVLFIKVLLITLIPTFPPFCKYNAPASLIDQQFWNRLLVIVKLSFGLAYNTPPCIYILAPQAVEVT